MFRKKKGRSKGKRDTAVAAAVLNLSDALLVEYSETNREMLDTHKCFLQQLQKDEDARQIAIEQKTTQLFSQTGLIIAVVAMFLPLILEKVDHFSLRLVFIAVLLVAGFFYLRTIFLAARSLDIDKYEYQRPSSTNVTDRKLATVELFLQEEIKDRLSGLEVNTANNNTKGTNLLNALWYFKAANITTALLSIALSVTIASLYIKDATKVQVEGGVDTRSADQVSSTSIPEPKKEPANTDPTETRVKEAQPTEDTNANKLLPANSRKMLPKKRKK